MQTCLPVGGRHSAIVAPPPHPLSSPLVTLPLLRGDGRICSHSSNLLLHRRFYVCTVEVLQIFALGVYADSSRISLVQLRTTTNEIRKDCRRGIYFGSRGVAEALGPSYIFNTRLTRDT